jgi:predicted ATPase/signal transduction histidine kinase/serine/threonine protein kinase
LRSRQGLKNVAQTSVDSAAYKVDAVLLESASTGVYRATRNADGRAVILKTLRRKPPRAHEVERLRREHDLGASLSARAVVRPLALENIDGAPTIVFEDFGGTAVERLLTAPLDVARFLSLAVAITRGLAEVHKHAIVHRDLKPANIIVREDTGEAWLADFGIASAPDHAHEASSAPPVIEGSLPYMSPEQTGRMNRTVDERSDLYSLGVTFYQMLSAQLPWSAQEPLEWIHCHLAREPASLGAAAPGVPGTLAAIVMKLLAKRPEDRYQTATGLLHDLAACRSRYELSGAVPPFELGVRDAADTFQIPHKLYGRSEPAALLRRAFDGVARSGRTALALVSGYSGIGKSSLVHELEAPVAAAGGVFVSGKFDQYRRDIPYSTIVRAFRDHLVTVLAGADDDVARLRDRLDAALGPNADLIAQMFPELGRVLGPRPPVPGLPPSEEEARFHLVFRQFLSVFTAGGRTLVLFLDDLQWADAASLRLLTRVLAHPDTPHLLTVGAYRDNEVYASHQLMLALDEVRKGGAEETAIVLGPLSVDDTAELVADTVHADVAAARPLAELVHEKTAGNPFFVIQFLTVLHDEGFITAVPPGELVWDVATIRDLGFTDNVVELMTRKLERLAAEVLEMLKLAACIGNTVDVTALAVVRGGARAATEGLLQASVAEGLVVRRKGAYRFLHDRVQQAAYSLIPEERRAEVHLRIGRLLLASRRGGGDEDDAAVFDIANHLNLGAHLMTEAAERRDLAALNLEAGRLAQSSTAYASAIRYFDAGFPLLGPAAWASEAALAYGLSFGHAECLYLIGRFDEAEARFATILDHTSDALARAAVVRVEVDLFTTQLRLDDAVDAAVRGLAELGVELHAHPSDEEMARTAERVWRQLGGRPLDELLDLPRLTDPRMRAALDILAVLFGPSHSVDPNLPFVCYAAMVEISLRHGNTDASAVGYAYFGMSIGPKFGRWREGYAFGKLGYDLAEKHGLLAYKSKLNLIFGDCIGPWSKPLLTALDYLDVAFRTAVETGDLTFACYCCNHIVFDRLLLGEPLGEVTRESVRRYEFARKASFDASCKIILDIQLFILALRGMGPEALGAPGGVDADAHDRQMQAYPWPIIRCWHFIMLMSRRYYLGDLDGALAAGFRAHELIWTSMAHLQEPEFFYVFALTLAAAAGRLDGERGDAAVAERAHHVALVAAHERKLAEWTAECPENFEAKWALVAAELARLEGRAEAAMSLYEQAIRAAQASGFVQNEALGLELASAFYRARGFALIADTYLARSRAAYVRWGAFGKAAELDRRHPRLAGADAAGDERPGPSGTLALRAEWLDLSSVVKASQSISSEVSQDRLVAALFRIVMEHGGAQKGYLVMLRAGAPMIEAEAAIGDGGVRARILPPVPVASSRLVPVSLIEAVLRTGRRVLLDDAGREHPFSSDEYIARARPRSVLGLPIVRRAEVVGLLYLENDALPGAFTTDRLAALELVAAQAAISLEIAKLVETERGARAEAEAAERRAAFLSDATALLVESLDYEAQLERLARLAVQSLADVCLIDLVDGAEIRRVAAAHKDPRGDVQLAELSARFPPRFDAPARAEHDELARALGLETLLALPLTTGGDPVGVITLASTEAGHRYAEGDRALARELANRAAIAISNARLYRAAHDAVRLRDDFLSVASHELRAPLTSLIESLHTLERRPWDGRPLAPLIDARRASLAARQAERLARLVGDLLDVSRLEAGQLALTRGPVDLGELTREVVARYEEDASRSGCVVSVETPAVVVGNWDASRLDQVVSNLLSNAIKFGAGKPIAVRVDQRGDVALLVMKDEGIGIEPQRQRTIFERFQRTSAGAPTPRLGLGLYVCRRFVDAHGGTITVSSRPGAGATFSVELPFS